MDFIDIDGVLLGILLGAFLISRVVQVANGRRLASIFSLNDGERVIFWPSLTLLFVASIYRTGWNAGNVIVVSGFLMVANRTLKELSQFVRSKSRINPPAPTQDATPESN